MLRDLLRRSPLHRPYVKWKLARSSGAREEHFTGFWRDNVWGDAESRSGAGSSLEQTAVLRDALPPLLRDLGVRSLLDVPCGDFAWMQNVDLAGIDYVGGDIVGAMIDELDRTYGRSDRRFVRLDVISDTVPRVDAVMVRDLFLHLPNAKVLEALRNVRASGATYLLASTYPAAASNPDVEMGRHRFPNLTLPPFSLPTPERVVDERPTTDEDRPDKQLAVWHIADL